MKNNLRLYVCVCALMLCACREYSVSPCPPESRQAIAHDLRYVEHADAGLKRAISADDYLTVEHTANGDLFRYQGKCSANPAALVRRRTLGFIYFRSMRTDDGIRAILRQLQAAGITAPTIIRAHNGLGNIAEPVASEE